MSISPIQPISVWCMFCCRHTVRRLGAADAARYCSPACAHAAEEERRARRCGMPCPAGRGGQTAAHWRRSVGERYLSGSVVASRPRCESSSKVRYETPTEAWVAAFIDFGADPGLDAYTCADCDGIHLGHANYADGKAAIKRARYAFDKALRQMVPTINEIRAAERRSSSVLIAPTNTRYAARPSDESSPSPVIRSGGTIAT